MRALARSGNRIKSQLLETARDFGVNLNLSKNTPNLTNYNNCNLFHSKNPSSIHRFSTQTQFSPSKTLTNSSGNSDLEDGFSDLDRSPDEESNEGLSPKSNQGFGRTRLDFPLFRVLLEASSHSMKKSLENWVKEGNELDRGLVFAAVLHLRKLKLFTKALQFMEWLRESEHYEFKDMDYVSLLDLYAKVHGPIKAENFLAKIPLSMCNEVTYRTLLANYVAASNVLKSEQIFNKMRDLGFPLTTFACNQLLLLYKRFDKKKISDVLLMMEREDLKPSLFTYKILIDLKGNLGDITGLEQILDTMKKEGIEPDLIIKSHVAGYYILAGFSEKAVKMLREIEGGDLRQNRPACKYLLPLYADLGLIDEIKRVWKVCELNPLSAEIRAIIEAWGKIGEIENAEKVFDEMSEKFENVNWNYYDRLMMVYANKKLVDKVEKFGNVISDKGIQVGVETLDSIVKMYVELGELNKAESVLQNWVKNKQNKNNRPWYNTYLIMLEEFGKRGDVHNAERIFYDLNKIGYYYGRLKRYELLLNAYVNAEMPVYGFRERMKADNLFPNKSMNELMVKIDPFRERDKFSSLPLLQAIIDDDKINEIPLLK